MKTLRNLESSSALLQGNVGDPAVVGNTITLYLDTDFNDAFPESITGEITAVNVLACDAGYSYDIEYDEDDLTGANFLRPEDVLDQLVLNETQVLAAELDALSETIDGGTP